MSIHSVKRAFRVDRQGTYMEFFVFAMMFVWALVAVIAFTRKDN